jgi:DNA/RNA endonuclease YhcR with UshA esterase domain
MNLPKTSLVAAIVALLVSIAAPPSFAAEKPKAPKPIAIKATDNDKLKTNIGKSVSVTGEVVSVGKGPKDGMRFLNFSDSKTTGFTAAIVPAAYPKLKPIDSYVGKRIKVTGDLETYKKKSVIKVTRPTQVKVMKPKEAKKKKKEAAE